MARTRARLIEQALADPQAALGLVLGDTLHPGGEAATRDLLDRAEVGQGTRVVDLGCGAGQALALAEQRGAMGLGLDASPHAGGADACAEITRLPLADASVDVVLSECALCLSGDLDRALAEAHRVLAPGGRLAFSDVTLTRELEHVPPRWARALCMTGTREPDALLASVEAAGFEVLDTRDHHDDLVAIRDRVAARVDYKGLLATLGERSEQAAGLLAAVEELEDALEAREVGYVSVVAEPNG